VPTRRASRDGTTTARATENPREAKLAARGVTLARARRGAHTAPRRDARDDAPRGRRKKLPRRLGFRAMTTTLDVDSVIERLLSVRGQPNNRTVQLAEGEIRALCAAARYVGMVDR
jgi:hypothetical protein